MPVLRLTQGAVALVDAEDFERVAAARWVLSRSGSKLYASRRNEGRNEFLHRFLLAAPDGIEVDHRDGDGLNNRRENLRLATRLENTRNSGKRNEARCTSTFKGVKHRPDDGRWQAAITVHGRGIHLGCYVNEFHAACAYDAAAVKHFGDFARLNFPASAPLPLDAAMEPRIRRGTIPRGIFRGVTRYKDGARWMAALYLQKPAPRRLHLGLFQTAEEAAHAYDAAARLRRPDALLNFP